MCVVTVLSVLEWAEGMDLAIRSLRGCLLWGVRVRWTSGDYWVEGERVLSG